MPTGEPFWLVRPRGTGIGVQVLSSVSDVKRWRVGCPTFGSDVWRSAHRGTHQTMLYTVFIVLAIIALLLFIFGRRRV